MNIHLLLKKIPAKVCTHKSFLNNSNDNSRYVFLGMYAFKARVADVLYKYYPGEGTKLQHYLGNLFKEDHLHHLYDIWKLKDIVRAAVNFDTNRNKHIFVYAVLGWLHEQNNSTIIQEFIYTYFIEMNNTLLMDKQIKLDVPAMLKILCIQKFDDTYICNESIIDGKHRCSIQIPNNYMIVTESVSKKYALKKCYKKALQYLLDIASLPTERVDIDNERSKMEYLKQKHQKQVELQKIKEQKLAKRKLEKEEKRAKIKAENLQKERNKLKAKQAVMRKREEAEAKARKEANKPMSASKRRHLEDKKK